MKSSTVGSAVVSEASTSSTRVPPKPRSVLHDVDFTDALETKTEGSDVLPHCVDSYNGVRMYELKDLRMEVDAFASALSLSLARFRSDSRRGCWLKLWMPQHASLLSVSLLAGFEIHHSQKDYLMLCQWLASEEPNMIPAYAHSYFGVHCFVVNSKRQLAVVREAKGSYTHCKIPGGAVDAFEDASEAALREVREETGLKCRFLGVLYVRQLTQFRFGTTMDVSLLCLCVPLDESQPFETGTGEMAEAKWMPLDSFLRECKLEFTGKAEANVQCLKDAVQWVADNWLCLDSPKTPAIHWRRFTFDHKSKSLSLLFHP